MKITYLLGAAALRGVAVSPISTNAEVAKPNTVQPNTVQELYQWCKSKNGPDGIYCLGFIAGIVTQMKVMANLAEQMGTTGDRLILLSATKFCSEAPVSLGAQAQAFINCGREKP